MKQVEYTIEAVSFKCPNCQHEIEEKRTGSLVWTRYDLEGEQMITCPSCGQEAEIPAPLLQIMELVG